MPEAFSAVFPSDFSHIAQQEECDTKMLIPFELCSKQVCAKHGENEAIHYFAFDFPYLLSCSPGGMLDITHLHSLSAEHLAISPYIHFREYSEQKANFLRCAECHL